ncbi:hypothetical protein [Flavobacterium sp. FlaQc-48]|uniref:hypothetical protein n=1 Tax=Flavobacterium sp. FlaQc-48 TaxID=3374181 RepID=UPI003756C5C7
MKATILFLFVICIFIDSHSQSKSFTAKEGLMNLLTSKHQYERALHFNKNKASEFKIKYTQAYQKINADKREIIAYIDNALKTDAVTLSKRSTFYNYENPLSSYSDPKNIISWKTYLKIVKESLEKSKNILPTLSEIPNN